MPARTRTRAAAAPLHRRRLRKQHRQALLSPQTAAERLLRGRRDDYVERTVSENMTWASFYDHAEIYDLLFATEPAVVDFYAEQAARAAGPVLELGCGTGHILVPLAQRNVDITGLDMSPAMLAQAAVSAQRAGVSAQLVQGDMRDFELERRFELVFVASNSLSHLDDLGSLRGFFAAARNHLSPQGRLVFDVSNPDVRALAALSDERRKHAPLHHPEWGELEVEERTAYDAANQVSHSLWHLRSTQHRSAQTFALHLRNFFPCELELLLDACGFTLLERFGDFDGAPFASDSPHQVCVCRIAVPGALC
jgi:SAM-dependent methyltransferase